MRINISPIIRSIIDSVFQRSSSGKDALRVGDKLVGRVLEIKNNGKALIDFGKFRALAKVQFPITEGDVINVKVLEKGMPLRLGLNNSGQEISPQAKKILSLIEFPSKNTLENLQSEIKKVLDQNQGIVKSRVISQEVKNIIARVAAHFEPMLIGKSISELSSQLKAYVENSGIFFEKKIENALIKIFEANEKISTRRLSQFPEIKNILNQDLKPNILMLKDFFDRKELILKAFGLKNLEAIRNTVERLLSEVVAQQDDTIARQGKPESVQVLTYVLPGEEGNQKAKLKVYYSKKKRGKSEEGFRISLLLVMDKIGQIRTDFFLMDKDLNITFFVNDSRIKEYVDYNSEKVVRSLSNHFKNLVLNVIVSKKEIEKFEIEDLGVVSSGLVDLKV